MISKNKPKIWLLLILGYIGITFMSSNLSATELPTNTQEKIIVDVRSHKEFAEAANPNSINIPLDELESKLSTLDKNKTIVVCCVSGRRSALAAAILKKHGFQNVINAGPWRNTL